MGARAGSRGGGRLVSDEKMASGSVSQAKKGGEVGLTCLEGKRKDGEKEGHDNARQRAERTS
jgi:hypothetical protein